MGVDKIEGTKYIYRHCDWRSDDVGNRQKDWNNDFNRIHGDSNGDGPYLEKMKVVSRKRFFPMVC